MELSGKQRRYLRARGSTLEPVVQVGKAGLIESLVTSAKDALLARELIKVRVLKNSPVEPGEALEELERLTGATLVQVIGRNGLLYAPHPEKPKIVLP